ncbi:uncharacterized protein LOC105663877 isoform X1 [Megachile rotundata]|uniref:uncharacterized protein LOC105663877 isoform X1 n=1 Tax=Megachile rotundata TaxID=143995 RepID=UPI003FD55F57
MQVQILQKIEFLFVKFETSAPIQPVVRYEKYFTKGNQISKQIKKGVVKQSDWISFRLIYVECQKKYLMYEAYYETIYRDSELTQNQETLFVTISCTRLSSSNVRV